MDCFDGFADTCTCTHVFFAAPVWCACQDVAVSIHILVTGPAQIAETRGIYLPDAPKATFFAGSAETNRTLTTEAHMAIFTIDIPASGAGISSNVATLSSPRTILFSGEGSVSIEISNDDEHFSPLPSMVFGPGGPPYTVNDAFDFVRARRISGSGPCFCSISDAPKPVGPTGPAGTIAIGTVTNVGPSGPPTVTNVGTPTAAVLNFGLQQGAGAGTVTRHWSCTTSTGGVAPTPVVYVPTGEAITSTIGGTVSGIPLTSSLKPKKWSMRLIVGTGAGLIRYELYSNPSTASGALFDTNVTSIYQNGTFPVQPTFLANAQELILKTNVISGNVTVAATRVVIEIEFEIVP
jgi:hypothetical protein